MPSMEGLQESYSPIFSYQASPKLGLELPKVDILDQRQDPFHKTVC